MSYYIKTNYLPEDHMLIWEVDNDFTQCRLLYSWADTNLKYAKNSFYEWERISDAGILGTTFKFHKEVTYQVLTEEEVFLEIL